MQTEVFEIGKQVGDFFVIRVVCLPQICVCNECEKIDLTDYICRCKCGKVKILSTRKMLDKYFNSCVTCQRRAAALRADPYTLRDLSPFAKMLTQLRSQGLTYEKMSVKLNELCPEYKWNKIKVGAVMRRLGQKKIKPKGKWFISDTEIIRLRKNRKSVPAIATLAGVSSTSVYKKLKRLRLDQNESEDSKSETLDDQNQR